jgi:hypothetical protein
MVRQAGQSPVGPWAWPPATDVADLIRCGGTIYLLGREDPYASASPLMTAAAAAAGIPADQFGYLAFVHEVIDRYGRFLTFLHRNDQTAKPRPYNEQLLAAGVAAPYLIWPNVAPFVRDRRVPNQAFRSEASTSTRPVTPSRPPGRTSWGSSPRAMGRGCSPSSSDT